MQQDSSSPKVDRWLSPDVVSTVGWVVFVALLFVDTSTAFFVGLCWFATYFMQFAVYKPHPLVEAKMGVFLLGALVCLLSFARWINSYEAQIDWRNIERVCVSRAIETAEGRAICDELQSTIESRANLLSSGEP